MEKSKLFQYAVLWHPTAKQVKEEDSKSKILIEPTTILAKNEQSATMSVVMSIPQEYKDQLDQVEVSIRPF